MCICNIDGCNCSIEEQEAALAIATQIINRVDRVTENPETSQEIIEENKDDLSR